MQYGIWNPIYEYFLLRHTKNHLSSFHVQWLFLLMYNFVTSCTGYLENNDLLSYKVLLNVDTFTTQLQCITLITTITDFIKVKYWEAVKLTVAYISLLEFHFCLKTWILSIATNVVSCFSCIDMLTFFTFEKVKSVCEIPKCGWPHFCQSWELSSKNVSWKCGEFSLQLETIIQMLLLEATIVLQ